MRDATPTELLDALDETGSATSQNDNGNGSTENDQNNTDVSIGCATIDGQLIGTDSTANTANFYKCFLNPALGTETEFASVTNKGGGHALCLHLCRGVGAALSVGGASVFRWTSTTASRIPTDRLIFLNIPAAPWPIPSAGASRMPWTANLSMSLATPLPFTKDFGTNGSLTNLEMFLAESDHHASVAQERTVLNRTLESALLAYMTLVRTREEIVTLAGHQQFLESLGASVRRRFDAGSVTLYDLKQVETDIENARDRQEIAWNGYVQASNALRRLLALREEVVFVPDVEEALAAVRRCP